MVNLHQNFKKMSAKTVIPVTVKNITSSGVFGPLNRSFPLKRLPLNRSLIVLSSWNYLASGRRHKIRTGLLSFLDVRLLPVFWVFWSHVVDPLERPAWPHPTLSCPCELIPQGIPHFLGSLLVQEPIKRTDLMRNHQAFLIFWQTTKRSKRITFNTLFNRQGNR